MGSYDNRWSGGTGPIPIAAISSPSLEKESKFFPGSWLQRLSCGSCSRSVCSFSLRRTSYESSATTTVHLMTGSKDL